MLSGCFFTLAVICFVIGLVRLLEPAPGSAGGLPAFRPQPEPARPPAPNRSGGFSATPAPAQPAGNLFNQFQSTPGAPQAGPSAPDPLAHIRVGERIRLRHPVQGELTVYVMGRAVFEELWQSAAGGKPGPQTPWTPTGNTYAGFWLETNLFLLNWQNRFYVLEDVTYLSDAEIQRDFYPHARRFAQSDQTADVYFAYPPASWHIDDIGKFRIRAVEGEGLRLVAGAVGRFIHASGDSRRALVLEDYESGGQDAVWTGYQVEAQDIG